MNHETLDLATAAPGVYAIHSSSPTVYLLDTRGGRCRVMRAYGGTGSRPFAGDDQWWNLTDLVSSPDLRDPDAIVTTDVVRGVVRVGSRHRYTWDPGGLHDYQWRLARVAERIEGPLDDDAVPT